MKNYSKNTINNSNRGNGALDELLGFASFSIGSIQFSGAVGTYYTVFDGSYAGYYQNYEDACEAAWYSTEIVRTYNKYESAKHALKVYKKNLKG